MSTNMRTVETGAAGGAGVAVEDCPLCELTDAVSCPACNGTGAIVWYGSEPAARSSAPLTRP